MSLYIGHRFCNMWSILNEITLQTELQNVMTNNVFRQQVKSQQKNIKIYCQSRESNRDLLRRSQMCYLLATDTNESIDCSPAI